MHMDEINPRRDSEQLSLPAPCEPESVLDLRVPKAIEQDWHPLYGERLAVFPRSLRFARVRSERPFEPPQVTEVSYWPDLASFIEDEDTRQMVYFTCGPSPYSVRVVYDKRTGAWETCKYRDYKLVRQCADTVYERVMLETTASGPEWDEPA
jgi:hypothetical protein